MEFASYLIELAPQGLVSPLTIVVAAGVWLLLATGAVGRIALLLAELMHHPAARSEWVTPEPVVSDEARTSFPALSRAA